MWTRRGLGGRAAQHAPRPTSAEAGGKHVRRCFVLALVALPLLTACKREPARPGPCAIDLNGQWSTSEPSPSDESGSQGGAGADNSERKLNYQVTDEGSRITIKPLFPIGGPGSGYGPFVIALQRKASHPPGGGANTTYTENGKTCQVTFDSRIERCTTESFILVGETSFKLDPKTCHVSRTGQMAHTPLYRVRKPL